MTTAYELPKRRKLANFKPGKFDPKPKKERARDRREGMSEAHLALIRRLWCTLGTERYRVECHHLKGGPLARKGGLGLKVPDQYVVPLFYRRHWELENRGSKRELEFFDEHGINPYALADALWAATGDLEKMGRVLEAHQEQGKKTVERRKNRFKSALGSNRI